MTPLDIRPTRPDQSVQEWIEDTQARRLKPSDIPTPKGRSQAGWSDVRCKVAPEIHTMLEQLLEHPALKGKFETKGQVTWMLIQLGIAAVYRYLQDNWRENDDIINSITYRLSAVHAEQSRIVEREAVRDVINVQKTNIKDYLDWGTPEGNYKAQQALFAAFEVARFAPNEEQYNKMMCGESMLSVNPEFAPVERYYQRMMRGLTEDVYLELTQEYFDELDHTREGR